MDSFEWNKIFGAVLAGILLILGLRAVAEHLYHPHAPEELAYKIEVPEEGTTLAVVEEEVIDFSALMASASSSAGARKAGQCKSCHTFEKGGPNRQGPNLFGVVNRMAGSVDGFSYSGAMSAVGEGWTQERLFAFLESSTAFLPGTAMNQKIRKPEDRANLIAYLRCNSEAPVSSSAECSGQ